jgi:NADH dehydrogenase
MAAPGRARVVVAGAGFGGLGAVRALAHLPVDVTLIDRNNYHTFTPLLYQVAAAELEPEEIAYPIRSIVRRMPSTQFSLGEISGIDFSGHVITTPEFEVSYDYIILATGSTTNFFGVPGAAEHALPLKTLEQAITLRNRLLGCFERAQHERDHARRRSLLTFAIVGGGPTGVEFAGALSELVGGPLRRDYRALDFREVSIVLLETADTLLPGLPVRLGDYARARLAGMGVDVRLRTPVMQIAVDALTLSDGCILPAATAVWTAGVRAGLDAARWGLPAGRKGQVPVMPTLQIAAYPDVYAIGDLAQVADTARPLPMLAPVAIQQGAAAVRSIRLRLEGRAPVPFIYKEAGTLATIGRNAAVAELGGRAFTGFPAWVLWLCVHLIQLIGYRNRLFVLINWARDYFLSDRPVRLILPSSDARYRPRK